MALQLALLTIAVYTGAATILPFLNSTQLQFRNPNSSAVKSLGDTVNDSTNSNSTNHTRVNSTNSNSSIVDDFFGEVEYEIDIEGHRKDIPVKNKFVLAIIELLGLGLCGIDRCYIGQTSLGVIKGLTLGALGVWAILDFFAVVITCISFSPHLNALGMRVYFGPGGFTTVAFWTTLIVLSSILYFTIAVARSGRKWAFLKGKSPEELMTIFDELDTNWDGMLTKEELLVGMQRRGCPMTEHDIDAMISQVDVTGDGNVNFLEFKAFAGSL